ncbi:MAG: hypothetical protein A2Y73_09240 [Chloroflexi bacterium RBG_13_56_8]|nr:MAG: hypothetical protein A2Y73_09240 [Chloroflexi bacterium RBG_13_56_8]
MSRFFIVRHGQTDYNAQGRYQGSTDIDLNEVGVEQAKAAAECLKECSIDVIVSSPLKRALSTARIIAEIIGCDDVHVMEQFAERRMGVLEELTREEALERYPEIYDKHVPRQIHDAPPGGETPLECGVRVFEGLRQIQERYPNQNVLLVAHGFVGKFVRCFFQHVSDEEFWGHLLKNGEIAEYSPN